MRVNRLVTIIMILIDRKRIGAKELADMLEVSTRTIYRDVEAISMAGIPVYSTSGVGGGFEIMEKFKIDKSTFSETDLTTILTGMSSIPSIMKSNDFINTHTKITSFISKDKLELARSKAKQMHIDFSNWGDHRDLEPYLTLIKISLQENKVLSFEYINHSGNQTKRQVEPYQLILKNSQWYFQGYCYKRNDFRLFKLSRISNLQIKNRTFIPKINPDPLLDTTEILTKLRITIKLRIHESILERILDYCDYENFSKDDKSHYIVNFPFIENDYYYSMLLGFGDQCECLEPLHVRSTLKEKIKNLSRIYES